MLSDVIERVNKARMKAMQDPNFLASAKEHQKAIDDHASTKAKNTVKRRMLSEIYSQTNFGTTGDTVMH